MFNPIWLIVPTYLFFIVYILSIPTIFGYYEQLKSPIPSATKKETTAT